MSETNMRRDIRPENHLDAFYQATLDEGYMRVYVPSNLSQENIDEAVATLELVIKRLRRGMVDNKTKDAAAAEYATPHPTDPRRLDS